MKGNKEVIFGMLSVIILIFLFVLANNFKLQRASLNSSVLKATFDNAEGVVIGTPVRYSGIEVGEVQSITLKDNFLVEVEIKIQKKFTVPEDSVIQIATNGILGERYLEIQAGSSEEFLSNGGEFEESVGSANVINLIKQVASRVKL